MKPGDVVYAGPYGGFRRFTVLSVDGAMVTLAKIDESDEEVAAAMVEGMIKCLSEIGFSSDKPMESTARC